MATITKAVLSGSTDGRGVLIQQTATAGTLIHTGPTATTTIDEVYLYAANNNTSTNSVELQILWGADTDPNDRIRVTIPAKDGLYQVIPGMSIQGNATALTIRALIDVTDSISIHGWANRIDQS